ncbi:glycosyltransferase [Thermocrispum municipale]|uniref:glycosyltransferase n=1 Tax=Thermocrispum municipale TaxID=37926 RepID=UPI000694ACFA|nr:glycosyltransferase [Thermocrispum municipale]
MTKPVVVLATSNGTGMGHLSRQLAVGQALQEYAEPVYFSLSRAVGVIRHMDRRGEYAPSRERAWIPEHIWHNYLRDRLTAFVTETKAEAVVFDGVVPYEGLLLARAQLPNVRFVWMRRGFWRPGARTTPLAAAPLFDLVLEPGDFAEAGDTGATADRGDAVRLSPITQLEHLDLLSREEAAAELGLDPTRPTALVTLSSGVLNDVVTPGAAAVTALLEDPEWQVAVVRSHIAMGRIPLADESRCIELAGVYPLSRYLAAFDAAVAAGGYNSVHELLTAGIPTLFVPNPTSGTDDQPARTRWLADQGFARYADAAQLDDVRTQARALHDEQERERLRKACAGLPKPEGSVQTAEQIADLLKREPREVKQAAFRRLRAKSAVVRAIGPKGMAIAKKALRRPPATGPTTRLPVAVVTDPVDGSDDAAPATPPGVRLVRMTEDFDPVRQSSDPVEHLIAGASAEYRQRRQAILRRYYDVRAIGA